VSRQWVYIIAGAALVAGGLAFLSQIQDTYHRESPDPIAEAQRLLSRAQSRVSEIEAGWRNIQPGETGAA
jgi:hypothetical protein